LPLSATKKITYSLLIMTIEAVYFDGGQRFTISIPQSLIPPIKSVTPTSLTARFKRILCLIVLSSIVLCQITILCDKGATSKAIRGLSKHQVSSENARNVKIWRSKIQTTCDTAQTEEDMAKILTMARDEAFPFSGLGLEQKIIDPDFLPGKHIKICPYVFIDFGSGVGDTVMDFMDSGLVGCKLSKNSPKELLPRSFDPMHFHADGTLQSTTKYGRDEVNHEFKSWAQDRVHNFDPSFGPEDYCVYGVEGNPKLKHKLKSLENNIARMEPSPLQHVHFMTQTVAGNEQGDSLFIDHAHEEDGSPGSSLFFNHLHLRESRDMYGEVEEYKADTTTLTKIMKATLSHYHQDIDEIETTRNHLILHIDIEGSEYELLNEARNSEILCDFALQGNLVDIFVKYHSPEILGIETAAMLRYIHEIRPYFERQCGDTLNLHETDRYFLPPGTS